MIDHDIKIRENDGSCTKKKKINLYIDIDGVLVISDYDKPIEYIDDFIRFVVENFNCFWLTTHCKGEIENVIDYLSGYFNNDLIKLLMNIKPTNWRTLKTEAINTKEEYFWLDDCPLQSEINYLKSINQLDKLILVELYKPNELFRIKELLERAINEE